MSRVTGFLLFCMLVLAHQSVLAEQTVAQFERPHVAIIIDDLGDRWHDGRRIIELPAALTIGIIPFTPYAKRLANMAKTQSKEVLLHLPMESVNGRYLGKAGLDSQMNQQQLQQSLQQSLSSVPNIRGVSNHMGSRLTQNSVAMQWLMQALQQHGGLYFVDSRTISATQAASIAQSQGLDTASRDVFLDHDPQNIQKQWQYFLRLSRQKGSAVAIGHPYPQTIEFLQSALPALHDEGVELVSISELIRWRKNRGKMAWQKSGSLSH